MKLLGVAEFLQMPCGTIYSEFLPCLVTGLFRKGESILRDWPEDKRGTVSGWYYLDLLANPRRAVGCVDDNPYWPQHLDLLDGWHSHLGVDFDEKCGFIVYDESDIQQIVAALIGKHPQIIETDSFNDS